MKSPELQDKPYYFLHTLVGWCDDNLTGLFIENGFEYPATQKLDLFLDAPDESPEGVTAAMGLGFREVMTTVSKRDSAVTYHNPFGLILEGEVRACFDNDTGARVQESGVYNNHVFDFTNRSTPDELMDDWYKMFAASRRFNWNEAILRKGSRVIGAFYDPRIEDMAGFITMCRPEEAGSDYNRFMSKARRCGLAMLEITAKFGVYSRYV